MSDASTVVTVKDIPNDALTTGLTNQIPAIPALGSAPVVPQNAVPPQPSFVGSIIGDKYVLIPEPRTPTKLLTGMNLWTLCVALTFRLVLVSWQVAPLPPLTSPGTYPDDVGPRSRAHGSTSSLNFRFDCLASSNACLARDKQQRQSV